MAPETHICEVVVCFINDHPKHWPVLIESANALPPVFILGNISVMFICILLENLDPNSKVWCPNKATLTILGVLWVGGKEFGIGIQIPGS